MTNPNPTLGQHDFREASRDSSLRQDIVLFQPGRIAQ